jgi:hypothetical protein
MLMAGHFSVWAVCAGAAVMEEREREKMRLDAVLPFITARKVSGFVCLQERCGCDDDAQLERVWSAWRDHLLQQRRIYTLAGALRIAFQSRTLLSHLVYLRSWSRFSSLSSAIIARAEASRRFRLVRMCVQVVMMSVVMMMYWLQFLRLWTQWLSQHHR